VAGAATTLSGTSPGIPAGRSWGVPTPAGRQARHPHRAHRSPVDRMRAPDPRPPGGAEVAPGARVARVARAAQEAPRPPAPHGRQEARRARGNRNAGAGTRAPGRHKARVRRRQPVSAVVGPRRARAAAAGSTTSGPVAPAGWWAMRRVAAACSRRRVRSRLPDDRCATPTSGRPARAAESRIPAGVRCWPMGDTLDVEAMIQRFRDRAHAVRNRTLPPVAGEERMQFIRQAEIDYQDFAIVGDAQGTIEDGVLVLRIDLRPNDPDRA
jgi:hypothetical protein